MTINIGAGEKLAIVATVDPQTVANSEAVTDAVDMSKFDQAIFILALGDMASETIDFRLESDSDSGFATDKQTLKAATQLAASATLNDNDQVVLWCRAQDLLANTNHRYVRGRAITGGATGGPAAIIGLGVNARHEPAADSDLATVVEIATV